MDGQQLEIRNHSTRDPAYEQALIEAVLEAIRGVRYGQITLIVQDGRVVQIDRTERRRLKQDRES